ncbi:EAL domain-containing protein [Clostridium sp. AM58-1XD]|uniref:bifunctional diguanylate cyclase/phosphodiesterase n=1 Tax=Clostridium sp. AM58-1XD TaxID=2292307 RepID=UPI000E4E17CF|nr:EAL domain-containing protein [Clostridium sp. AM58-1XD]RGY97170.1 EAL domain-containing protein [Clostridium sp. AM58-1XD]
MRKKSRSIQTILIFLITFITMVQTVLFLGFIVFGGFAERLKDNAVENMTESTENNRLYLEKELLHRWVYLLDGTETLTAEIQGVLSERGQQSADIRKDPELNQAITRKVSETLINMLHSSIGNSVFLVLDGPAAEKADQMRAGIYIRDLDSSSHTQDNSDLLLERGLPSISKELGIALDSYWNIGFSSLDQFLPYDLPVEYARSHGAGPKEAANYGYFSRPFALSPEDVDVVTYSVPLIMPDGDVIGVVGYDITLPQLEKIISDMETELDGKTINLIGFHQAGTNEVEVAAVNRGGYEWYFKDEPILAFEQESNSEIRLTSDFNENSWYAGIGKLEVYNHNTPFEDNELVLVRMRPKKEVLSFYQEIQSMLFGFIIVCLLLSLTGGILAGKRVTAPIKKMMDEIREKQQRRNIQGLSLKRLGISEIDEMGETIEKLSAEVEKSSSKISHILELTEVPIGVYEYLDKDSPVFCSRTLISMLNWGKTDKDYIYMPPGEFHERMKELNSYLWKASPQIYYLDKPKPHWVKHLTVENKGGRGTLGAFMDETAGILEKKKLEWERNYDILTSIYNRRAFREEVERIIAEKAIESFAVVMWDLDNLKYINDTFGHEEGDRYIARFAGTLRKLEREGGIISRYSGDEFVTIIFDENGKDRIRSRLKKFMEELQADNSVPIGDQKMTIRVSAGLAWYPEDAEDYSTLVHYADFAMYVVKHSVKGALQEFDKKTYEGNYYMLEGREELNRILEEKRVKFAFQPIIDRKGEIYGYELLMRPQTDKLKGIEEMLRLAKEQAKNSQVERLTWMESLKVIREKVKNGELQGNEKLFINSIANVSLTSGELNEIEAAYPDILPRIVMEITESEPLSAKSAKFKRDYIDRWNAMVAIDDFGTGYNSEANLLEMRPHIVKIDMHLIRDINDDANRQLLLRNIMSYTREAEIKVLAEGVETREEIELLMEFGIDLYQGYYIARPQLEITGILPEIREEIKKIEETCQKQG